MLTFIVVAIVIGLVFYCGYVRGDVTAYNHFFEEKEELKKEIDWRKDKTNDTLEDLKKSKSSLRDALLKNRELVKYNTDLINENDALTNKLSLHLLSMNTIEMKNQEEIIEYYKSGMTYKEIAEKIGCGQTTIQRAIKKWGIVR